MFSLLFLFLPSRKGVKDFQKRDKLDRDRSGVFHAPGSTFGADLAEEELLGRGLGRVLRWNGILGSGGGGGRVRRKTDK